MNNLLIRVRSNMVITVDDVHECLVEGFGALTSDIQVTDLLDEPATPEREPDEY